jgi:hypothetical protein
MDYYGLQLDWTFASHVDLLHAHHLARYIRTGNDVVLRLVSELFADVVVHSTTVVH